MNVIGIIPQYPDHSKQNIYGRVRMPPVGIISVLSQLGERFDVYAIDENNYAGPDNEITGTPDHAFLQKVKPAKIAMLYGGMSNSVPRLFTLAKQYKEFGAVTIAGGSHVDALPEEALRSGIDVVVHGEGEYSTQEILETIVDDGGAHLDRDALSGIAGISYLDDKGQHVFTGKRAPIEDLDALKSVDLMMFRFLHKKWTAIPINRGRGCNWNCEFCVVRSQYGKFKARSVERVLEEIMGYYDLGYKQFFFTDDNFAQNEEETVHLCKLIGDFKRKKGKRIGLTVQVRSEIARNDRLIDAMKYAGVRILAIGYESPINEDLKAMRKGVTVEKLVRRSRKLAKDFYLHGMFIFGYPSDAATGLSLHQKARAYSRFFKKARLDTVQVLNAVPLPGSDLRARLEREGRILPQEAVGWDRYDGLFLCYVPEKGVDPLKLQSLARNLMRRAYLGSPVGRTLNYGNWMRFLYYSTIGFPVKLGSHYVESFLHSLERRRRRMLSQQESPFPEPSILTEPLSGTMWGIVRDWRNLIVKTLGGGIVDRWYKAYHSSEYNRNLREIFSSGASQALIAVKSMRDEDGHQ